MARHAIICGGSIGGLFAAAALQKAGWTADIYERSAAELSGRGAGIVTHPQLVDALQRVGADTTDLGVEVFERTAFDKAGGIIATLAFHQVVTSWDRIHQSLRRLIPARSHHLGKTVTGYRANAVRFRDGSVAEADVIVGADGFRSAIRAQMLPQVRPEYSGYVVWRALASEADLPPDLRTHVFERFGFYLPSGQQAVGYPIAGPGNDLRPGHRRYNFVWYTPVAAAVLNDMLTDSAGKRHPMSIPPPLVRHDVLAAMRALAQAQLPGPFAEILLRSGRPFFTPIYDHLSPVMAQGHIALLGDAACVARPHVGMGVTKAAEDALALAGHLSATPVNNALTAYSFARAPAARAAYERARQLGAWILEGGPQDNPDGRSNSHLADIMRLTATAEF